MIKRNKNDIYLALVLMIIPPAYMIGRIVAHYGFGIVDWLLTALGTLVFAVCWLCIFDAVWEDKGEAK